MPTAQPSADDEGWRQRLRANRRRQDIEQAILLIAAAADAADGLCTPLMPDIELVPAEVRRELGRIARGLDDALALLTET